MLLGLPRAGTIRGLNTISPGLLCAGKVTSISQDRAQHLICGRIVRVETHDLAQRLRCFSPFLQFVLFTGQAVPDHGVFRLLGEHCGEDFDFRLVHQFVLSGKSPRYPVECRCLLCLILCRASASSTEWLWVSLMSFLAIWTSF